MTGNDSPLTKNQFVEQLAAKYSFSKAEAQKILNSFLDSVEDAVSRDGRLTLKGFGTFMVGLRAPRKVRNFRTGEEMQIPEEKTLRFLPSETLKKALRDQDQTTNMP